MLCLYWSNDSFLINIFLLLFCLQKWQRLTVMLHISTVILNGFKFLVKRSLRSEEWNLQNNKNKQVIALFSSSTRHSYSPVDIDSGFCPWLREGEFSLGTTTLFITCMPYSSNGTTSETKFKISQIIKIIQSSLAVCQNLKLISCTSLSYKLWLLHKNVHSATLKKGCLVYCCTYCIPKPTITSKYII